MSVYVEIRNKTNKYILLKNRLAAYSPFIILLILMFAQYRFTIPQGDDFMFGSMFSTTTMGNYTFEQIISNFFTGFMTTSGRTANVASQIFLLNGLAAWQIITPILITLMSIVLFHLAMGRLPASGDFYRSVLFAALAGLIPFTDNLATDSLFWLTGSCNYLYPVFFCLVALIPLFNEARGLKTRPWTNGVAMIAGILAASMHELSGAALLSVFILMLIYLKAVQKKKIPIFLIIQLCIALAFYIVQMAAPGNYARLLTTMNDTERGSGIFTVLMQRIPVGVYSLFRTCGPLLGICGLVTSIQLKAKEKSKAWVFISCVLFIGSVLLIAVYLLDLGGMSIKTVYGMMSKLFLAVSAFYLLLSTAAAIRLLLDKQDFSVFFLVGAAASALLSVLLGLGGRAFFPSAVLLVGAIFYSLCQYEAPKIKILFYGAGVVAAMSMLIACYFLRVNSIAYTKTIQNIEDAKMGKTQQVVIAQTLPMSQYAYYNAFNKKYAENIRTYYSIPRAVSIDFK